MIKIDFEQDFKKIMIENIRSIEGGSELKLKGETSHDLAVKFYNCSRKTIYQLKKYEIKYCFPIAKKLEYFSELEFQYFKKIELYIKNGDEKVRRYLSKMSIKGEKKDRMLIDYGVYHFHIGEEQMEKEKFSKRSDYLLFVFLGKKYAYFIDIRKHNEKNLFKKKELLEILDNDYPNLLEAYVVKGTPIIEYKEEDIIKIKKSNINTAIKINNKYIFPIMGVTSNGSNIYDIIEANKQLNQLKILEEYFRKHTDISKDFIFFKFERFYNNKFYIKKYINYISERYIIYDFNKILEIDFTYSKNKDILKYLMQK